MTVPRSWVDILRAHQPSVFGGCLCGWDATVDLVTPGAPAGLLSNAPVTDHGAMARHQAEQLAANRDPAGSLSAPGGGPAEDAGGHDDGPRAARDRPPRCADLPWPPTSPFLD